MSSASAARPGTAEVAITDGRTERLRYDVLVVTPGSVTKILPVPGQAEQAIELTTFGEAIYLRNHVLSQLDNHGYGRKRTRRLAARWRGNSQVEVAMMPQQKWSKKRERQYEHVKSGLKDRGYKEDTAEEIAARTVNKERARSGESDQKSRTSTQDISSGRRGGKRSGSGPGGRTKDQLYEEAKRKNIKGRSKMSKRELEKAVGR